MNPTTSVFRHNAPRRAVVAVYFLRFKRPFDEGDILFIIPENWLYIQ